MKSSRQSLLMLGVALLVIAGIMLYIGLSQPRVYNATNKTLSTTEAYIQPTSSKAGNAYYTKSAQSSTAAQTTGATAQYTKQNAFPINLNTATADELTRISGIGEKRAASIIAYRESIGGYTSVDQIKNIRGIGDATYAKIAPYLTV